MSVQTHEQHIAFDDCWPVPADWAGNPARRVAISVAGQEGDKLVLKNMRPTGSTLRALALGIKSPWNDEEGRRERLMATLRDGHGHGAEFSDTDAVVEWRETYFATQLRAGDTPEEAAKKGAKRTKDHEKVIRELSPEIDVLNNAARSESGLYVAFEHPDSPHRNIFALARYAGVALSEIGHDMRMTPLVLGMSAVRGYPSEATPQHVPYPNSVAWPYLAVGV